MSRTSTIDREAIAKYCTEPRSIKDICLKFRIGVSQAHKTMTYLGREGLTASRRIKGSGTQHMVFLLSGLETENAWGGNAPFMNPLMAHDPFGRTAELASQLLARGINVEKFAKQSTRKIAVLDIDPLRKGNRKL